MGSPQREDQIAENMYFYDQIYPPHRSPDPPSSSSDSCAVCGYDHRNASGSSPPRSRDICKPRPGGKGSSRRSGNDKDRRSDDGGGGGADNKGKSPKDNGSGGSGKDGAGDAPPSDQGAGSGGNGESGSGGDGGDNGGGTMNGDDPKICSDMIATTLFGGVIAAVVTFVMVIFYCGGTLSFSECLYGRGTGCNRRSSYSDGSCPINDNLMKYLNKTSSTGGSLSGGNNLAMIPPHLHEAYQQFKKALNNTECFKAYGESKCNGLVNYASVMAGATIFSSGNTVPLVSSMQCKCRDKKLSNQRCTPNKGPCTDCRCTPNSIETIITEESKLIPGVCWSFSGSTGEVEIKLFFPILVTGASIRHPSKRQLIPGFFSSAPKDFELWGHSGNKTNSSNLFGKFEYKEDGGSTQIFEVQNFAPPVEQVKFNFLSNHGNPEYTAIYKLEVHGLLDST